MEGPITTIFSVKHKNTNKIACIHNDISKVFGKGPKSRIKRILDRNIYEKFDTLVFVSIDNFSSLILSLLFSNTNGILKSDGGDIHV